MRAPDSRQQTQVGAQMQKSRCTFATNRNTTKASTPSQTKQDKQAAAAAGQDYCAADFCAVIWALNVSTAGAAQLTSPTAAPSDVLPH
jgi:hypothetical protein